MVGDHYSERWTQPGNPFQQGQAGGLQFIQPVSRAEFDQLKREVDAMKELLIKAKAYDQRNGEPDCEMAEKVRILREVAKLVGVDLAEVFGKEGKP
jgi:hypothetical protein